MKQGRGTQVIPRYKPTSSYSFLDVKSISSVKATFKIKGECKTSSQRACIDTVPATKEIAEYLCIPEDTPLYRLQRVKMVNDVVFSYVTSYVEKNRVPGLDSTDEEILYLYRFLKEKYGIIFKHCTNYYSAKAADFIEARVLGIKTGIPVILVKRIAYDDYGPFEYSVSTSRSDILELEIKSEALDPLVFQE